MLNWIKRSMKTTPHVLIGLLMGVSVQWACSTARYTTCLSSPAKGGMNCNATGDPDDNFVVPFKDSKGFGCYPPNDHKALLDELKICRGRANAE